MRPIKFRAWTGEKMRPCSVSENGLAVMDFGESNAPLMQFTGLLDKNGKEIYEGDVVRIYLSVPRPIPLELKDPVFFHEGAFSVATLNGDHLSLREVIVLSNSLKQGVEVIGNIYENSDLLNHA